VENNPTPILVTPKAVLTSKVILFNIFAGILALLMYGLEGITSGQLSLGFEIPAEVMTFIVLIGNALLRLVTKAPVTSK
jgi:hypothetical protein